MLDVNLAGHAHGHDAALACDNVCACERPPPSTSLKHQPWPPDRIPPHITHYVALYQKLHVSYTTNLARVERMLMSLPIPEHATLYDQRAHDQHACAIALP